MYMPRLLSARETKVALLLLCPFFTNFLIYQMLGKGECFHSVKG